MYSRWLRGVQASALTNSGTITPESCSILTLSTGVHWCMWHTQLKASPHVLYMATCASKALMLLLRDKWVGISKPNPLKKLFRNIADICNTKLIIYVFIYSFISMNKLCWSGMK